GEGGRRGDLAPRPDVGAVFTLAVAPDGCDRAALGGLGRIGPGHDEHDHRGRSDQDGQDGGPELEEPAADHLPADRLALPPGFLLADQAIRPAGGGGGRPDRGGTRRGFTGSRGHAAPALSPRGGRRVYSP